MNVIFLFWLLFFIAIALYFYDYKNIQASPKQIVYSDDSDLLELIEEKQH